jgi:hypothetical protein
VTCLLNASPHKCCKILVLVHPSLATVIIRLSSCYISHTLLVPRILYAEYTYLLFTLYAGYHMLSMVALDSCANSPKIPASISDSMISAFVGDHIFPCGYFHWVMIYIFLQSRFHSDKIYLQ